MTPESSTQQQSSPAENGDTLDDMIAKMRDDEGGDTDEGRSNDAPFDEDSDGEEDDSEQGDASDDNDDNDDDDIDAGFFGDNDDDEVAQRFPEDEAFDRGESARALPGLLSALCDAPFSAVAQDAVRQAATDTIRSVDDGKGARRLPPSPEDRITALMRAHGVILYLLAREVHAAQPKLSDTYGDPEGYEDEVDQGWAASVNLGRWREAWGDAWSDQPGSDSDSDSDVTARILAMAARDQTEWVASRCSYPTDTPREMVTQVMRLSKADREDRTMTLLATAGLNDLSRNSQNTLAASCVGLLAALNAPPDEVQDAIDHALNVGRAAMPNLLAIAPAAFSIQQGRPLADQPETQVFVGYLIEQFAALLSTVLAPDAWQSPPTPAEGADPADSDAPARPDTAAAA